MNSRRGFMRERPFMGQAAPAPAQQEMSPLACPTGPDTLDVIDSVTGFVYYRNQPGKVNTHPDCQKYGYTYGAAPSPTAPAQTPGAPPASPAPESIKWLGPTPGSPYKPFLSSYPPVNSSYTVAQGTPFNTPKNIVNAATTPALPAPTPPPMEPLPPPPANSGSFPVPTVAVGVVVAVLIGAWAYLLYRE